ncbi:MAG: SprT family zinc-dependent metalloprotease [Thiomicrorhabdus chilensis]|uniref:M48 family metallopeptidase n=1 Tax=Thiomicrorhabdus chilensis TaxID=63656 RepID=UPI00299EF5AF|nr:SprT family zinc-dependent metalloprotease [Thiomicrorhabdus chilensis]MDX1346658.1 SprT family zinc-dependent metalloprotease [Thiomicrorhabdus chilensis]
MFDRSAAASSITIGGQVLPIVKSARKKSIALKSQAAGVELHVPRHLSDRALTNLLKQNTTWIEKKVGSMNARVPPAFECCDGNTIWIEGQACSLRLNSLPHATAKPRLHCELQGSDFMVYGWPADKSDSKQTGLSDCPDDKLKQRVCQTIQAWFVSHAQLYFDARLPYFAKQIGVSYASIEVKTYKARWGSCYADGRIQFNWKLLQAPTWVVDYVIVHELCHLMHANHSPAFWQLVNYHYPHTPQAKRWLKQEGAGLIHFLNEIK